MTFWTPDELRRAARGEWMALPDAADAPLAGVSIDTRTLAAGEAFVAIPGDRFDGHDFLGQAREHGAPVAVVERDRVEAGAAPEGLALVGVDESRRALGRVARAWRGALGATRVVGVTGSAGKTTTVRILEAVLSVAQRGAAPLASHNNDIGVPLTVLRARRGDQYLLCEIGMSGPGEIESLAATRAGERLLRALPVQHQRRVVRRRPGHGLLHLRFVPQRERPSLSHH